MMQNGHRTSQKTRHRARMTRQQSQERCKTTETTTNSLCRCRLSIKFPPSSLRMRRSAPRCTQQPSWVMQRSPNSSSSLVKHTLFIFLWMWLFKSRGLDVFVNLEIISEPHINPPVSSSLQGPGSMPKIICGSPLSIALWHLGVR